LQATVVDVEVEVGEDVAAGEEVLILEAMKMEHVVVAPASGTIEAIHVSPGDVVAEGAVLVELDAHAVDVEPIAAEVLDLDATRRDLDELRARLAGLEDAARPQAVEKRHGRGQRTARENVYDLLDDGSFREYGALALAAQRGRRSMEELIERSPADGVVGGVGTVNAEVFGARAARCMVVAYDYTVFAGTQGVMNHKKQDRLFALAADQEIPLVLYAEGGGGRPGDTDYVGISMLDNHTFTRFARLSGHVPLVGVVEGRCFAGNAALLGCCDVIIATPTIALGMAGPAMIEGGGLGSYAPEEIGPIDVQTKSGVVDIVADDEADATRIARQYLGYFQGRTPEWSCADQRRLRHAIPDDRLRVYDVRKLMELLFDERTYLEVRKDFGAAIITAFARVEGYPVGVIANDCAHLGGAIDARASDKASRFLKLCDAFDIPVVTLCDTPGFMVGPESEAEGMVRHAARLFTTGASLDIPVCTVVLRKAYGLGAQAMAGGGMAAPSMAISWPTAGFGAMAP